jgi:transposase
MLRKFAKTLAGHWKGILAFYDYPISTGPLEGTNNKIKTGARQESCHLSHKSGCLF